MSIQSMTGFARATGEAGGIVWTWEVKSVNGKGLDVRVRVPSQIDGFDVKCRGALAKTFSRGSIYANLSLQWQGAEATLSVNRENLDTVVKMATALGSIDGIDPPTMDGLLRIKGVIDLEESRLDDDARAALEKAFLGGLGQVSKELVASRRREGEALAPVLSSLLNEFDDKVAAAKACAEAQPQAIAGKLRARLDDVLSDADQVDGTRLEHEIALLSVKADIREELDRLSGHINAARELMTSSKPMGRKLDFLCQEFNREANTLTSKSQDIDLTKIGLELKALIDQFREQVQNIE